MGPETIPSPPITSLGGQWKRKDEWCMIHRDTDTYTDTGTYNDTYTQGPVRECSQKLVYDRIHTAKCLHQPQTGKPPKVQ